MSPRRARNDPSNHGPDFTLLWSQIALLLLGLAVLICWPRPGGSLLLVPTTGALSTTINMVLAHRGRIVAAAPAIGGIIVRGDAGDLAWPAWTSGTLMIGVPAALCGEPAGTPA